MTDPLNITFDNFRFIITRL